MAFLNQYLLALTNPGLLTPVDVFLVPKRLVG